ncbi:response regulator [Flavilitoribacter nigricans]|uniref:DNA-binding response regulator n=1 Tax=Flavilitoribacter nigricans (strain ATCC 23147 / DSM 23189 / NBRC 102662 / NCIMB 1420 / SS-2) TaxID=1122177 RepID=A0A2D0N475_FLAN2|nr:response regulator transcription factor [Flavilitoribacter nigricans]PHN03200.1 DNA-binding response regulator [Flavilitoribacter nigricans DSM 23189 = NBRC 102662]
MANILLVDDHQIIIDGLRGLLEGEAEIGTLYEANSGESTLSVVREHPVDLILLDINLPDKSGFDICQELKKQEDSPRIIALTMYSNTGYINKMINAGVDGYLLKNTGQEELLEAVRTVMGGDRYFSKEVMEALLAGKLAPKKPKTSDFIQKLTRREKEVLKLIVEEYTTDEIADKLFISPTTVTTHRKTLLRKLNAKNVAGLVKKAFEFNLLKD